MSDQNRYDYKEFLVASRIRLQRVESEVVKPLQDRLRQLDRKLASATLEIRKKAKEMGLGS